MHKTVRFAELHAEGVYAIAFSVVPQRKAESAPKSPQPGALSCG